MYIWEQQGWPHLTRNNGRLLGVMARLGFDLKLEAQLGALTKDIVKSSETEGEFLDRHSVRSSLARRLGLPAAVIAPVCSASIWVRPRSQVDCRAADTAQFGPGSEPGRARSSVPVPCSPEAKPHSTSHMGGSIQHGSRKQRGENADLANQVRPFSKPLHGFISSGFKRIIRADQFLLMYERPSPEMVGLQVISHPLVGDNLVAQCSHGSVPHAVRLGPWYPGIILIPLSSTTCSGRTGGAVTEFLPSQTCARSGFAPWLIETIVLSATHWM